MIYFKMSLLSTLLPLLAIISLTANSCLAVQDNGFIDDTEIPFEPFLPKKSELFRFSRAARAGWLAKYEQEKLRQQTEEPQAQQQVQAGDDLLLQQQQQQQQLQSAQQQVEVNREAPTVQAPSQLPAFGSTGESQSQTSDQRDTAGGFEAVESSSPAPGPAQPASASVSAPEPIPVQPAPSRSSSSSSSQSSSSKKSKSSQSKTIRTVTTTTTTTTTKQINQEPAQVARLQEVRVSHTVPLSEAVHYVNYMVPATKGSAAKLEEEGGSSASSSSSSQKSSSSSSSTTQEQTESVAMAPAPAPAPMPAAAIVHLPPVGPDCVLQRLIVERPINSALVVQVPSDVSVSQSSSSTSSHSSRMVESAAAPEPPAVVPPVCCIVKKVAPVYTAKLVVPPVSGGGSFEEHHHSENSSSRKESHGGLAHSMSSSSSSSSSSRSSKSSTTTTSQTAALVAPPPPTMTIVSQPMVRIKSAPLVAVSNGGGSRSNSYSVNVDHHYNSPNVKYGYSIKQQGSEEPGTKGMLVGERVVYLK